MSSAPVCVYMFQERDILEVIWVGKEGITDKIQWETGDPVSPYAAFNMLLLWFPALWNSDNTDWGNMNMVWLKLCFQHWKLSHPLQEPIKGWFSALEINSLFHQEEGLCTGICVYEQLPWAKHLFFQQKHPMESICTSSLSFQLWSMDHCKKRYCGLQVSFCLWLYLILGWNRSVLNSAFFWPNFSRTFPCNERA